VNGLEEEADGGDSAGSGVDAGGGIRFGDSAEGQDGSLAGGGAGGAESVEACSGNDDAAIHGLFEDRTEEDQAGAVRVGAVDVGEGMAGDADGGLGAARGLEELPDLPRGELLAAAGQVDAVGAGGNGDIGAGVDEQTGRCAGCPDDIDHSASEADEFLGGEILFAELDEIDPIGGEAPGLFKKRVERRRFGFSGVRPVGDGVTEDRHSGGKLSVREGFRTERVCYF